MIAVFLRTFILYIILIGSIRLMGKRQIGELQLSELVTTLMISEFAVIPIQDKDTPILYGIVPILILLSIEVISSFIFLKSSRLKKLFMGSPSIVIYKGKIVQSEMKNLRLETNELISELRLKDISDINDVEYAILEGNGKLSVFPKAEKCTLTPSQMKIAAEEKGIAHTVIADGKINDINLKLAGRDREWLKKQLDKSGYRADEIFLMTLDDSGKTSIITRDKSGRSIFDL